MVLKQVGTDVDLATFLSSLAKKIPTQPQMRSLSPAAKECRTAMQRASTDISGMSGMHLQQPDDTREMLNKLCMNPAYYAEAILDLRLSLYQK